MSLGITFIHEGCAFIASDRRSTLLDSISGENTSHMRDIDKLFKKGNFYYTILGVEPLTGWVQKEIDKLIEFDIDRVKEICRLMEKKFWDMLDDNLKKAKWLHNGEVELLSCLWASDEPQIGVISSEDGYTQTNYTENHKLLAKSAAAPDKMLEVILKHFSENHPSIESIFNSIFQEASKLDSAISKEFDLVCIRKKIKSIYSNKLTAGTIDASKINVINLDADNIKSGTISGDMISGGTIEGVTVIAGGNNSKIRLSTFAGSGTIDFLTGLGNKIGSLTYNAPDTAVELKSDIGQINIVGPYVFINAAHDIYLDSGGKVFYNNSEVATQAWIDGQGYTNEAWVNAQKTSSVSNHNHGIPDGTVLATADGGSVTWTESGGHYHWTTNIS